MPNDSRRNYLLTQAGLLLGAAATAEAAPKPPAPLAAAATELPAYARQQDYTCLRQSSFDRTGGNADSYPIEPSAAREVFAATGPGIITHIWFTIAAESEHHLKELVLRIYWDGNTKPSVEVPIGDFFGLNLGQYFLYQSAFLNCSSVKALNAYFAMPFAKAARITVTNEGDEKVHSFYSNIDYKLVPALPSDALYFHAQYRQAAPTSAEPTQEKEINLDGKHNYVFVETEGRGQFLGVTLGVLQNNDRWFGEGDDMSFVNNNSSPVITGTGTEDYFCGAWDFGGRDASIPFANLYNGAPHISLPERTNGRYCLYRWHADNPITFTQSFKHTIEHGHADDRGDSFYSVAYWYQSEPYTKFPTLPPLEQRLPVLKRA